jgi:hypothetical protein
MTIRRTKQKIDKRFKESGQYWIERFPARLGNYARVVNVPGKPGMVYARLETSGQVVEAINYLAPAIFDVPVFVGRDKSQPSVLKVSEIRWIYAAGAFLSYLLAFHSHTHEYPNADTVFVRRDQIMPLLVLPAGGFNVRLFGDIIYSFSMSAPIRVEDADLDLSSYAVTVGAQYVLLEVLTDGTLNYVVGDLADSRAILESGPLPTPSNGAFPVCAFEFFGGQTELRRDSTERTIIDLRMFTSNTGSGAGDQINAAPVGTLADAYYMGFWNTVASRLEKITWANVKATLKAYFDTIYAAISHTHSYAAEAFKTIVVSGQSDVVADSTADTLTLVAGSGMTITTNASTDTITFSSPGHVLIMSTGVTHPPVPVENAEGTDWIYSTD